jgi:hypothetical protein
MPDTLSADSGDRLMKCSMMLLSAALFAAPAVAAPADSQLYFATIVDPSVKVYLDGNLLDEIPSGKLETFDVTPGAHTLRVVKEDGTGDEKQVNFDRSQLADAKGGRWWCAVSVTQKGTNAVKLFIMPTADCKSFVEDGN